MKREVEEWDAEQLEGTELELEAYGLAKKALAEIREGE